MKTRTVAVTAAAVGAAVIATTGITYASAAGSTPAAAPSVQQAAPAAQQVAPDAAPLGGEGGGNGGNGGKGNEGGYGGGNRGGNERGGNERGGFRHKEEGRIFINERSYSARGEDGCITVVSGLGARSFNVRNDSRRTVEFFRGATCDNGSPVATVGPWSTSNGVFTRHHIRGGVFVKNGVVGSFRVVRDHYDREW
ncbi:hypothetical protein [Streptomyces sp. NBC_01320]|uniref:hypothetical protein n=1 Tax=Streptomyces sp. NBC_01320 TaxID=2903824 RepID=UPI002E11F743|nr:hypothetical protein OG395_02720 [Streptomyces sp. NBC_01320]WSJ99871.1 hypothetical protein OG395_46450 [Streptomyces sp. NBC_01320]WSK00807.1 hypothetical protein OG395_52620 [Streptomyces sp. NBC_01320]